MRSPREFLCCAFGLFACFAAGCGAVDQIEAYEVPKPELVYEANHVDSDRDSALTSAPKPFKARMIAAMAAPGPIVWFFKVVGPVDAVSEQMEEFLAFVESLRFAEDDSPPQWTLPEGWQERPGSSMRYATLMLPGGDSPLELSVTRLANPDTEYDDYVLINVNRWRGQMALPEIGKEQLYTANEEHTEETRKLNVDGATLVLVNLLGMFTPTSSGRPPFAGGRGGRSTPMNSPAVATASRKEPLTYDIPDGWTRGTGTGISVAAFTVERDGKRIEVTVTPAGGDLLRNVRRWCGQIELEPLTREALDQSLKKIVVDKTESDYVELIGPVQTILAVVAKTGATTWFIKLKGDTELAGREKQRFEQFVKSIQFQ